MSVIPPSTLGDAGRVLWSRVADGYQLRPDELAFLEDACAAADMIAALEDAWSDEGRPMTAKGSMGQLIIHPLIGEIRVQRAAKDTALARLKLPEDGVGGDVSSSARAAATARWSHGA